MKIGVVFPQTEIGNDPAAIRDYAQAVEAMGYTHILAFDHVVGANPERPGGWKGPYTYRHAFHEPFVLFGFLAATELLPERHRLRARTPEPGNAVAHAALCGNDLLVAVFVLDVQEVSPETNGLSGEALNDALMPAVHRAISPSRPSAVEPPHRLLESTPPFHAQLLVVSEGREGFAR